jgi:hypothetical protein
MAENASTALRLGAFIILALLGGEGGGEDTFTAMMRIITRQMTIAHVMITPPWTCTSLLIALVIFSLTFEGIVFS